MEAARAEAERVRLTGAAEARAIEAVGRAEAEKMRMKASAYKQYGDAAVMALVLEALPQVTLPNCPFIRGHFVVIRSHTLFTYHRATRTFLGNFFLCFSLSRDTGYPTVNSPP